jgi:hypothetical protein
VQQEHPDLLDETDDEAANRQTASLCAVAITLLLLVAGLFLVRELHAKDAIADCLMDMRVNCNLLVVILPDPPPKDVLAVVSQRSDGAQRRRQGAIGSNEQPKSDHPMTEATLNSSPPPPAISPVSLLDARYTAAAPASSRPRTMARRSTPPVDTFVN